MCNFKSVIWDWIEFVWGYDEFCIGSFCFVGVDWFLVIFNWDGE